MGSSCIRLTLSYASRHKLEVSMHYNSDSSGVQLFTLVVGTAALLSFTFFRSPMAGGDLPIGYPHEIRGVVVKDPSTRFVRSGDAGREKVALSLYLGEFRVPPTLSPAYHENVLTVECNSTRCTQILKDETHLFACRGDGRFFEPNVVVCKHIRQE